MLDRRRHEIILSKILLAIYSDSELSSLLGFKGGTACYLFYNLPRFSVDLDFNLINSRRKNFVFEKLSEILSKFGKIKDARVKRNTLFFLLSYQSKAQKIKLEVSLRKFKEDKYEIKNYLGLSVLVMKKDCLAAHKIAAILDRKNIASRDLFDAYFFLKNDWPINDKIIKERTGKTTKKHLIDTADYIQGKKIDILQGLGELVEEKEKQWIKKNLIKELVYLLKLYAR